LKVRRRAPVLFKHSEVANSRKAKRVGKREKGRGRQRGHQVSQKRWISRGNRVSWKEIGNYTVLKYKSPASAFTILRGGGMRGGRGYRDVLRSGGKEPKALCRTGERQKLKETHITDTSKSAVPNDTISWRGRTRSQRS